MRIYWIIAPGNIVMMHDIHAACSTFFQNNKVLPDTVKMSYQDMSNFLSCMPLMVHTLERGKEYGHFLSIPGGMVELLVLEQEDEVTVNCGGGSMMVVESTQIDREFERHVLDKDQNA